MHSLPAAVIVSALAINEQEFNFALRILKHLNIVIDQVAHNLVSASVSNDLAHIYIKPN